MSMVCRPILLHNEYVSAMIGKREYRYLVLGHHDGMTVGDAFLIDADDSFENIFSFNAKSEGQLSDYSTQFFYGFHNDVHIEKSFWENEFPFIFVSFIQFEDRNIAKHKKYLESLQYRNDEMKALGMTEQLEDIRIIAYYALDNSDIILVIQCRESTVGTQIINNLHQDICGCHPFSVRNSYSVLAINREYVEKDLKTTLLEESIEWIELRIIEKEKGSINGLYKELRSIMIQRDPAIMIDRKGLMGTEDEAITLQNIRWKDLLPLYREETGILMNSNRCSQKYASAITTKMHYSISIRDNKKVQEMDHPSISTPFCDYLYQMIEEIYKSLDNASAYTERKNLVMLVNALRKIEYSSRTLKTFNDYCFYTIMFPVAMFIRLRERDDDNAAEFYQFIKYIKLCMQNITKPDRVYQQVTDINIRYFDAPVKLVALYNAYVYYAKQILNVGTEGQYEFLLCPGMNRKTEVKELYQGTAGKDSRHLFRVEIPEAHIYNTKLMFFTLGHEVSHFVGRVIRRREDRYESILKLVSRMTALGLKDRIGYINEFDKACFSGELWKSIECKIYKWTRFHVEGYLRQEYMEGPEYNPDLYTRENIMEQIDYYKKFYRHTSTLKIILNRAVDKILHTKSEDLFDELIWKDINAAICADKISYDERKRYYENRKNLIATCVEAFSDTKVVGTTDLTLFNGIDDIMYLLEECYADLSCILLLNLPLKDYLGNLVKTLELTGYKVADITETKIITRIALVMAVMSYGTDEEQSSGQCFVWDNGQILRYGEKEIIDLQEEALDFTAAYLLNEVDLKPGEAADYVQRISLDSQILREIISYLLKCRKTYYQNIRHDEEEKVQRFYGLTKTVDSEDFFIHITMILKDYEEDIYKEIPKLIESEEGTYGK